MKLLWFINRLSQITLLYSEQLLGLASLNTLINNLNIYSSQVQFQIEREEKYEEMSFPQRHQR